MKNEESAGQKPSESQPIGQPPSLLELLAKLIETIQDQTDAITHLAVSNEALVEAMGQEDPDPDAPSDTYMDGSRVL